MRASRSTGSCAIALGLGLAVSLGVHESAAEAPAKKAEERAIVALRIRFGNGQELESAGRWADALDDFRPIMRSRPTPEVTFHVALCLDHLGRLIEARAAYRLARSRARKRPGSELVITEATSHLTDLEARLPRVTLAINGDLRGTKLVLDGDRVVDPGNVRVDPGPHVVVARRGSLVVAAVAFSAHERHSKWITVTLLDGASEAPIAAASQASRRMPIERATPSR